MMTSDRPPRPTRLIEHDGALDSLLAALLAEVPEAASDAPEVATAAQPARPADLNADPPGPLTERQTESVDRPSWAAQAFRVLLFGIGEFRFALPLIRMRSVALLPDGRVTLPGQPPWHLGVARLRGGPVVMADLGLLVGVEARCSSARYLLVIGDGNVALVCDHIDDAPLISPEQVRWQRGDRGIAWLAGLLSEAMCVLLDADALVAEIRHG